VKAESERLAHPEMQWTVEAGYSSAVHPTMQGPVEVESSSQAWPGTESPTQVGPDRTGRTGGNNIQRKLEVIRRTCRKINIP